MSAKTYHRPLYGCTSPIAIGRLSRCPTYYVALLNQVDLALPLQQETKSIVPFKTHCPFARKLNTGINRDDIQLKDMEDYIMHGAFNEDGLWHSSLIEKNLVDAFVPFLPLERRHVKMCIKDDLEAKGYPVTEDILSRVADELQYFPSDRKLFSKTGCKRVSQKVDVVMEDTNF